MYCYPLQPTCTDLQQHLFPKERSFLVSAIMTNANKCSLQQPKHVTLTNKVQLWPWPPVLTRSFSHPSAILPAVQLLGRFARGHGHCNITSNCAVFHCHTYQKTFFHYSLSFYFSINTANSVGFLLCQSFCSWQNRNTPF